MKRRNTNYPKVKEIKRVWHLLDAKSDSFGRIASKAASHLMGKNKVNYSSHLDAGDFVVLINASKLVVTGTKMKDKKYHRHSWYLGSLKTETLEERLSKNPKRVFENAIRLMLPKNSLLKQRLKRLKIFESSEHTYQKEIEGNK